MLFGQKVVAVVPALDEAPRIARVVGAIPHEVDHIVVVDDGSRDGTAEAARSVPDSRVVVLSHVVNRGVGAAIVTGYVRSLTLADAPRSVFVVMAGDGQMDPRDLPALVLPIADGRSDYVKGNRFAWPGVTREMPLARRLGGRAFARLTSIAIGQRVHDSQCGYTAISAWACRNIDLAGLWPGYGYPNDLLAVTAASGLRIAEVPVRPIYRDEVSRLRPRHLPTIGLLIGRAWARRTLGYR